MKNRKITLYLNCNDKNHNNYNLKVSISVKPIWYGFIKDKDIIKRLLKWFTKIDLAEIELLNNVASINEINKAKLEATILNDINIIRNRLEYNWSLDSVDINVATYYS